MADAHTREALVGANTGGGSSAFGLAARLSFAAAPTFAGMALWTGLSGGEGDMLCMSMQHASLLGGMALMYALMSAFHAGPWLRLVGLR